MRVQGRSSVVASVILTTALRPIEGGGGSGDRWNRLTNQMRRELEVLDLVVWT